MSQTDDRQVNMSKLAQTPPPPYYAVIFSSLRTDVDQGYLQTAQRMEELAALQPGFLGIDSAREQVGITVSYWETEAAIAAWKAEAEHSLARERGRQDWYSAYELRVARVERAYSFQKP